MDTFEFYIKTKIFFGKSSRFKLINVLFEKKWDSVGIIIDHNLKNLTFIRELIDEIEKAGVKITENYCRISEPTYDSLEEIRPVFNKKDLNVIIGIGGGSTIDMAKAMAVLINNKKPAIFYRGFDKMTEPVLPIIAIPTTAGTGSEVTPNASFVDTKEKKKMGINGEAIRPEFAFLDPELTLSCPIKPTISAALDSIVHAVEAFSAKKTNIIAKFFAKEGFKRVFSNLLDVIESPDNVDYRTEIMYGAFLCGVALMHSGPGPAAAMSYPLGVHYKVPHGLAGAIFLPFVIEYNIKNGYFDYSELYDWLRPINSIKTDRKKSYEFLKMIINLWDQLQVPKSLKFIGFKDNEVKIFINDTIELKLALEQNPIKFNESSINYVLKRLI